MPVKGRQQTVKHELLWALNCIGGTTGKLETGIRSLGRKIWQAVSVMTTPSREQHLARLRHWCRFLFGGRIRLL